MQRQLPPWHPLVAAEPCSDSEKSGTCFLPNGAGGSPAGHDDQKVSRERAIKMHLATLSERSSLGASDADPHAQTSICIMCEKSSKYSSRL